jgi:hypothetical protein
MTKNKALERTGEKVWKAISVGWYIQLGIALIIVVYCIFKWM